MLRLISAFLLCASLHAQQFEVVSVKPSKAEANAPMGIKTGHDRLEGYNVTLQRCIIGAYGVGPHQIVGGPDWLNTDRFEILAKAENPINDDAQFMLMLRDVLADRFKLALHRETKTMEAYVLEVAKNGPKLEKTEPGESVTNSATNRGTRSIDARHTDMDSFAKLLARAVDLPVVNHTGLEGQFNFKLQWARESVIQLEGPSIYTAIQEQLGLRLHAQKTAVEVLMIDHAEKPSEN